MARKLIAVVALLALVSLASAGAALAETYYLTGVGENLIYQEIYGALPNENPHPGNANGEFEATFPTFGFHNTAEWAIARMKNTNAAIDTNPDPDVYTYTVTYDALKGNGIFGPTWRFYVPFLNLASEDLQIITTATYKAETEPDNTWVVYAGETLYGSGKDTLGNNFTLHGILEVSRYNSSFHDGMIISNLTLEYPSSAVPLPAGIWLLGTGLLGLGCLGRRRRK